MMDDHDARRLLLNSSARERLRGARYLLGRTSASDRPLIRRVASTERDQYVRAALMRLLLDLPDQDASTPSARESAKRSTEPFDQQSQFVTELTNLLSHEVATVVGVLRHYAAKEILTFDESETRREIDRLEDVLGAIRQFGDAAVPPEWERFDLPPFMKGLVRDEQIAQAYDAILTSGSEPHEITGSRGLLTLFVHNALANAVEATRELPDAGRGVVVRWATDDREHSISVIDSGVGVTGDVSELYRIGATTKDGHPGMGLAVAGRVAATLGGSLTLAPQERGGSICRLTWPVDRRQV